VTQTFNKHIPVVKALVRSGLKVLLYGPPGTAKTTTAKAILDDLCGGSYIVTCHEDLSAQELIAMWTPKGGEFKMHLGPGMRAYTEGKGLILNEIDKAAGPVWTSLYSLLDDPSVSEFTLPDGNTYRPHPNFRVIATSNQPVDVLPDALRDRLPIPVPFMELTEGQLSSLPAVLRKVAVSAYAEGKFPQVTFRKIAAYAGVLKNDQTLTADQQQDLLNWAFGDRASDVYSAIIAAAAERKKKTEPEAEKKAE